MGGWSGIALASLSLIVWRHPLAQVAGRPSPGRGGVFHRLCLATGSIWGRPTWGTWWQWDGRLTSMLLLLFVYLGYIALARADAIAGGRRSDTGVVRPGGHGVLPVIRYSVVWWNTLHQGQSIGLTGSSIDKSLLWPLPIALGGFTFLFGAIVLMRMRTPVGQSQGRGADAADGARMNQMAFVAAPMRSCWAARAR